MPDKASYCLVLYKTGTVLIFPPCLYRRHTPQNMQSYGIQNVHHGVIVSKVIPGGAGQRMGIMPGDVIESINHHIVNNISEYVGDIDRAEKSKPFLFYIRRGNMKLYLAYSIK